MSSEGNAAKNFAALTAANIHLSDERVAELKLYSYEELQKTEENENLREMMRSDYFSTNVDYAYVLVHLKEDEVKYKVSEGNTSLFAEPIGTPLDIMWLLDVTTSNTGRKVIESTNVNMTADVQRYSYYIDEDAMILSDKPTYIFNKSEWGNHISGYAPLYSNEGTYIGAVGVDLKTSDYDIYRQKAMLAMETLICVLTITLILMFLYIHIKYKKSNTKPIIWIHLHIFAIEIIIITAL